MSASSIALLVLLTGRTILASETVSVAGVVLDSARQLQGGLRVGLFVTKDKGGRRAEDTTSEQGVYHVIAGRLINVDVVYVIAEKDKDVGLLKFEVAQWRLQDGVRKITAPPLSLDRPQAAYSVERAGARILLLATIESIKATAGVIDEKTSNANVEKAIVEIAVLTVVPEKAVVTEYVTVVKEVPYTYTVHVPVTVMETRQHIYYRWVSEEITEYVPVRRLERSWIVDPYTGRTRPFCQTVTEWVPRTRTVMRTVPEAREVQVPVTAYRQEQRQGTRTVTETVPQMREITLKTMKRAGLSEIFQAITEPKWDAGLNMPEVLSDREKFLKLRERPEYRRP